MRKVILGSLALCFILKSVDAIKCYICNTTDSSSPFQCSEWFDRFDRPDIVPQDCSSVHDARYCIKHIGRFEAFSIKCYQCSAAETLSCADLVINMHDSPLKPEPCDHVVDAKYCIKTNFRNGGIGAKRFCSSKDLGNYCDYVKNKGDQMEYRSCVFTCDTDGCNGSSNIHIKIYESLILCSIGLILKRFINYYF